jgi:hypothetical protein
MAISELARPQGEQPAGVFYPLGHPTMYAYAQNNYWLFSKKKLTLPVWFRAMLKMSVKKELTSLAPGNPIGAFFPSFHRAPF